MATPPTFQAFGAGSSYTTTTTPKTVAVTVAIGDLVVVMAAEGGASSLVTTAPTSAGMTFTQRANLPAASSASVARLIAWTAPTVSAGSITISVTRPASAAAWNALVWVWRDHGGVGAVGAPTAGSTSNSATLTCSANSGISVGSADFNAGSGARTRRTVNGSTGVEDAYNNVAGDSTLYASHYNDTGAAGSQTVGYSAPTGQQSAIAAIEILGTAGGGSTIPPSLVMATRWN